MSIADLPNELLLEIASYLSFNEPSRVHLAITCPRLYGVFMPGILEDQVDHVGKLIAESKVILYKDFEARRLVSKKTFISESFRTSYHTLVYRVSGVEKDLWCVKSLIARALYLQDVVLQLAQPCSLPKLAAIIIACAFRQGVQLTVSGTILGGESGGPFTIQFHSSESLLIAFPKGNKPTSATSKVKSRPRLFRKIFYLLSKFFSNRKPMPSTTARFTTNVRICTEQKVYAVPRQPEFNIVVPPKLVLASLKIDSGTPFLPSLYPFTLAILNRAPITDLSLSHISFTLFVWSQILPSITMPTLAKLSIGNLSIAFPDLLAFLERHRFIETLDLTDNDVIGVVKLPPTDLLPNLNLFTANSEYCPLMYGGNRWTDRYDFFEKATGNRTHIMRYGCQK
ncbi:hypothetical protein GALMADRAFT_138909 [Galerina marginata CBS 339.88]|uniref:F-box domain-containing protein n=1 Tax=Galerina marginata (strain CBS 339.88) TaxID=685588 RepID=A0A067TD14_GALM3|nr:hypothetical protein GALMADRAFT_138909 [Galerina marginata CBS 339.88]